VTAAGVTLFLLGAAAGVIISVLVFIACSVCICWWLTRSPE
jgi:hypothetical protein